jgi:hypothetical protein
MEFVIGNCISPDEIAGARNAVTELSQNSGCALHPAPVILAGNQEAGGHMPRKKKVVAAEQPPAPEISPMIAEVPPVPGHAVDMPSVDVPAPEQPSAASTPAPVIEPQAANPAATTATSTETQRLPARKEPATHDKETVTHAPAEQRQPGEDAPERPKPEFKPVRGWTSRFTGPLKYNRLSDADMEVSGVKGVIAFRFNLAPREQLPAEVLALMRANKQYPDGTPTGLKFESTRKHGKIWMIPNDVEGRTLADKIDFRLSELAHKMEETLAKAPF